MIKNLLVLGLLGVLGCQRPNLPKGYQGVIEQDERVLSFEVGGRVTAVRVKRGDVVKPGEVLVEQDDTLERLTREARASEVAVAVAERQLLAAGTRREEVTASEAQVRAAREAEGLLRRNAERVKGLAQAAVLSESDLDRAESELSRAVAERQALEARAQGLRRGARREELKRAEARVESTQKAVALEDERLTKYRLRATIGGEVTDVHVDPGELAGAGMPAITLIEPGRPFVDVFIPQGKIEGVSVGAKASIKIDAATTLAEGTVEWISPQTEFTPRFLFSEQERPNLVIRVRVRIADPEKRLHAGVPAFVEIAR